jgi:hypothetical protein
MLILISYMMWLGSYRNNFIVWLTGSHATWL